MAKVDWVDTAEEFFYFFKFNGDFCWLGSTAYYYFLFHIHKLRNIKVIEIEVEPSYFKKVYIQFPVPTPYGSTGETLYEE